MTGTVISALISATGTASQIDVTPGLYPVYSISTNPILPGTGSVGVPHGTTAQRVLTLGAMRLNTDLGMFEVSTDGATWTTLAGGGGGVTSVSGTANQITSTGGATPVIAIASNPILPGTGGVTLPTGTTGQRAGAAGTIRFNTTTGLSELTNDGATWSPINTAASSVDTVSGTAGRITSTGGNNPVIDIDAAYVGQTSIVTLGTVSTGTWAATAISEIHGGTNQTTYILGDTLYASGANTLSKLSGNTTAVKQYLSQTGTGAVSAAPAWDTISGGDITGDALTKTDDTNVTLTLGGTPATALLRAASLTLGWIGQLALTRGGTNAPLVADNGGIVYSTAAALAILASTPTASKMLLSGASAAPTWSTSTIPSSAGATANKVLLSDGTNYVLSTPTFPNASAAVGKFIRSDGTNWIASTPTLPLTAGTAGKVLQSDGTNYIESTPTYPSASGTAGKIIRSDGTNNVYSTSTFADTYTASNLLYSNGANTVTGLATANSAVLVTTSAGVPGWSGTMTNGQLIIGSTGATPTAATLTPGTGVTITNGAASITIAFNGALPTVDQTSGSVTMAVNTQYITDNGASLVTYTIPATAALGDRFLIKGKSSGLYKVQANTGQTVNIGNQVTTSAGSLSSTQQYDCITITCITANTVFVAEPGQGFFTVA